MIDELLENENQVLNNANIRRDELFDAIGRVAAAFSTPTTAPPLTNVTAP